MHIAIVSHAAEDTCRSSYHQYVVTFSADHSTATVSVLGMAAHFGQLHCEHVGDADVLACSGYAMDAGFGVTVSGREEIGKIFSVSIVGDDKLADLACNF